VWQRSAVLVLVLAGWSVLRRRSSPAHWTSPATAGWPGPQEPFPRPSCAERGC